MPIFEYLCNECGHKFEKLQKSADEKTTCPACASLEVKKTFSAFTSTGGSETKCFSGG